MAQVVTAPDVHRGPWLMVEQLAMTPFQHGLQSIRRREVFPYTGGDTLKMTQILKVVQTEVCCS